jgi:hypothetical protein
MADVNAGLDAELDRLVRRLRGFSPRAWSAGERRVVVRRLAAGLVALGEPGHELPEVPDHALGDVIAVLAREAMANGRRDEVATAVREALERTR